MTLIKSISGIRGTIGGKPGDALTPADMVKFAAAFGAWIIKRSGKTRSRLVIGRDARISGEMVYELVSGTLKGLGIDIVNLGHSTTPTVEMAVVSHKADGGIIITASHNPKEWNALKLLNERGEFISAKDGEEVLAIAVAESFVFAEVTKLGKVVNDENYLEKHIAAILKLDLVDVEAIKAKKFRVAFDAVNSTGGIAVPMLLKALGVETVFPLYDQPNGEFPHNPEPLPENLRDLSKEVVKKKAHVGFAVDPDVDRLAIVCEDGEMFGEEYTLVAVADYVLNSGAASVKSKNTVSNLSSTRALRDVTEKAGGTYFASAVGEVNVVEMMKANDCVIGGEGNGGIIYPELHYGRDALVGIALFLSLLAKSGKTCSVLRQQYPDYYISKNKIELTREINVDKILSGIHAKYKKEQVNTIDGVKVDFAREWVHLRKSNTEPIIRIYAESESMTTADNLANKIITDIKEMIKEMQ